MPAYEREPASHQRSAVQRSVRSAAPVPPVLDLQRAAGNAAVSRLVEVQRRHDEERHEHGSGCGHNEPVQRSSVLSVIQKAGRPVDPAIRAKAEQGMGTSFGDVQVHDGPDAQRSTAELGARAYTTGRHIVVGAGGGDEHTMLHELRHTWQQQQGSVAGTDNGGGISVSNKNDKDERDAESWATSMRNVSARPLTASASGGTQETATASASAAPAVQRAPNIVTVTREPDDYEDNGVSYVTRDSMAGVPRRRNPDQNTLMGRSAGDAVRASGNRNPGHYSWLHRDTAWSHGDPVHGTPQRRDNMLAGTQETNMEHLRYESGASGRGVDMLGAPITQMGTRGRRAPNVYSQAEYSVRSPYDPMNDSYSRRLDPYDTRPVGQRERAGDLPSRHAIHDDMERSYAHWTMRGLSPSAQPEEYREYEEEERRHRDRDSRSASPRIVSVAPPSRRDRDRRR
ncbi:DUF4157 domain-containing protein [Streptomyces sp. CWNU-52B]|uniref:eCIS core domain-containing protein n=1 Tax=unclassified Streptomyces TaxID=2593676 RepID=UPI0039C0E1F9